MRNKRLDEMLIERGLARDKHDAFVKVTEGVIFVEGQKAISPSQIVNPDAQTEVRRGLGYVGRGALKLEAALDKFGIDVSGKVCADLGAATGGFTEVLLKRGAKKVYAIDTARGKLDLKLREDPRVIVTEGTDVRDVRELPDPADLVTIDVSLIPLREILVPAKRFLSEEGSVVALFKPQYETRDPKILKHGIVRDEEERRKMLEDFVKRAEENGWLVLNRTESPIRGSEGNVEFLLHLKCQP